MILKRRLANLERHWPRRKSAGQLVADAENLVRLTGITIEAAFERLVGSCSLEEIEQMIAEVESVVSRRKKRTAVALAPSENHV